MAQKRSRRKTRHPAKRRPSRKKQLRHHAPSRAKHTHHAKKRKARPSRQKKKERHYIKTGVPGFDQLFEKGIPQGASVILAGGAGAGKTLFGLQTISHSIRLGKKCLYMSFEESERSLLRHMEDFGWDPHEAKRKHLLKVKRFSIFDISRSLDALLAKSQGELLIDVKPIILPEHFTPDIIIVDSLTAIASAFHGKETYRAYIEHLFRYFESLKATTFLITETEQVPTIFSPTGVEEFLADGVIVLYNIRKGDIRESAIEILKMRGARHVKKVVAMQITDKGIEIFPEQQVFGDIT